MITTAKTALDQGCRDPFVRYLWLRQRYEVVAVRAGVPVLEDLATEGISIAKEMERCQYPAFLQAFAASRALDLMDRTSVPEKEALRSQLFAQGWRSTMAAIRDPDTTETVACTLATLMDGYYWHVKANREDVGRRIDAAVEKRFGDCATLYRLRGERAIKLAWEARGDDYADTVTEAGAREFKRQLLVAEQELGKAWEIDPTDSDVPRRMITICMGLCRPQDEMERWFQRALETGQDCSPACSAKAYYLDARWHGSLAERLAFSRECVAHPGWGRGVALELWDAHSDHRRIQELPLSYFARPEVWADIKESFTVHFVHNPRAEALHLYYAYHAWLAKDWEVLVEQLALADPAVADLKRIGGREVYERMVADAKAHTAATMDKH